MTANPASTTVLVSGASGFVATHCILQLLQQGYRVRGTLRDLSRAEQLHTTFAEHVQIADGQLEFFTADLLGDDGWDTALHGCDYAFHVASPAPPEEPKDENEIIVPAVEGTLRVLRAAAAANVRRVVLTSSLAAVSEGYGPGRRSFDEKDWSNLDTKMWAYFKSKTLAERAAWDFIEHARPMELSVINPGYCLGPCLTKNLPTSGLLIAKAMRREVPGAPRIYWPLVDVRDVAAAHIAAMTTPAASGQRFCCAPHACWTRDIALILKRHFAARGYRIPTREIPDFVVRLVGLFDPTVRMAVALLGREYTTSTVRIEKILDWHPRPLEESIVSMAESMIRQGIV